MVVVEQVSQDLRYGVRVLLRNPLFSAVALGTFGAWDRRKHRDVQPPGSVVLRLLPVRHPEQLVIVRETGNITATVSAQHHSWPMFEDLRDNNRALSGMFCRFPATVTIGYGDRAAQISAELVSGSYFPILGVEATLGRTIVPDDTRCPTASRRGAQLQLLADLLRRRPENCRADHRPQQSRDDRFGVAQPVLTGVERESLRVFVPIMDEDGNDAALRRLKDRRRRLSWSPRTAPQARRQPRAGATFAAAAHA